MQYTSDAIGNQIEEWTKLNDTSLWAYFRQIGGNEYYAAGVSEREAEDVVFSVNWRNDLKNSMRIVYKGQEYEIIRIDPYEGYKSDIKIYCKLAPYNEILR